MQGRDAATRAEADRFRDRRQRGAGDGRIGIQPAERTEVPLRRPHRGEAVLVGELGPLEQKRVLVGGVLSFVAGEIEQAEVDAGRSSSASPSLPLRTTLNPRAMVQNSSSTEMSNERLVTASQVPGGLCGIRSSIPAKKFVTLRCSTITPLGLPVDPDV